MRGQRPAGPPLSVIRWEDPPDLVRPSFAARDCVDLLVEMAGRPCEWALVAAVRDLAEANSVAARLRGQVRAHVQAVVRPDGDWYRVYARWVRVVGR